MRLLSTILIALLAATWLPFGWVSVAASARIPPCHQHGTPSPTPGPVSHQCCQSGHSPAIVKTLQTGPGSTSASRICTWSQTLTTSFLWQISPTALHHNSDPLSLSPLRV